MSKYFGPFYPPELQRVVDHAQRMTLFLRSVEAKVLTLALRLASDPAASELWLVGRADEAEAFVGDLAREYLDGAASADRAAAAIDRYVALVHDGLAHRLGIHPAACCLNAAASVEARVRDAARTPANLPRSSYSTVSIVLATPTPTPVPGT